MSRIAPPAATTASVNIARSTLRNIADRIPRLRDRGARISEEDTKRVLITPIIEALGWSIYDTDEVRNEYRHSSSDNPVDYALFLNRSPVLFVEAKPLGQGLDDRKWLLQTLNYANAAGVDWCVLTNGALFQLYKVHAQVEAERKLFASVSLESKAKFDDALRVLGLLTRDNMRVRAIDDLWQAWHVDRQVKAAIESVLQEDAFAGLIRKRVPQIALAEIRRSLQRANFSIDYPNIFAETTDAGAADVANALPDTLTSPLTAADAPLPIQPLPPNPDHPPKNDRQQHSINLPSRAPTNRENGPRRIFQSTQDLVSLGRLRAGDVLTIRGRANSEARVVDGRLVDYRGDQISFLEWGKRVTGWKAIQIYTAAYNADGRSLDQLRDEPQANPANSTKPPFRKAGSRAEG